MPYTTQKRNRRRVGALAGALLAAICLAVIGAVGADAAGISAKAPKTVVALRATALGRVLVDARGRTLYLFAKDKRGKSTCTGACAAYWPPLVTAGKPVAGAGVKTAMLGTTKRGDGRLQVTYNHHPLYTFALDKKAGQTKGEEASAYGAVWYAVSVAGAKVEKDDSSAGSGGSSGGGSGGTGGGSGGYGDDGSGSSGDDGSGSSSGDGGKGSY